MIGKPAVLDLIVVSPLNSNKLNEAGATGRELQGGSYRAGATGRELQGGSYRAGATGRELQGELQGGSYRAGATGRELQGGSYRAGATGRELQGGSYRAGATGRELQGGSYRAGATGWELQVGATGGSAAQKAKACKHNANDHKCRELGWVCILLAVETYGCWGEEAQSSVSHLAARLALLLQCSMSKAITSIYQDST
eukprot:Em0006g1407a